MGNRDLFKVGNILDLLGEYKIIYPEDELNKDKIIGFIKSGGKFCGKDGREEHITGSAWIVNKKFTRVLLTHHKKLERWVQLGGHMESGEQVYDTAFREAFEESGLMSLTPVSEEIFDIDVFFVPEYVNKKEHWHYDIRFLFCAEERENPRISCESHDVKWLDLDKLENYTTERSILRMRQKCYSYTGNFPVRKDFYSFIVKSEKESD